MTGKTLFRRKNLKKVNGKFLAQYKYMFDLDKIKVHDKSIDDFDEEEIYLGYTESDVPNTTRYIEFAERDGIIYILNIFDKLNNRK